eukprot:872088-Pelagomonas_calceolata.AAC.2
MQLTLSPLPQVAEALKNGHLPDPEPYPCVSLFFSDIVGYTDLCSKLATHDVMDMLHRLYSRFDDLATARGLFKGVWLKGSPKIATLWVHAQGILPDIPATQFLVKRCFTTGVCACVCVCVRVRAYLSTVMIVCACKLMILVGQ